MTPAEKSAVVKQSWADPVRRARRLAGMQAAAAKRNKQGGRVHVSAIPRDRLEVAIFGQ